MKHIIVKWSGGVTIVRSELDAPSEDDLTEHEQIINELQKEVEKLKSGCDCIHREWYEKDDELYCSKCNVITLAKPACIHPEESRQHYTDAPQYFCNKCGSYIQK